MTHKIVPLIPHLCDEASCMKPAIYSLMSERGWRLLDLCEEHAKEEIAKGAESEGGTRHD